MQNPIGVIFDLDGTLVASDPLYFDATQELLLPLGRSLDELTPEEKSLIPGRCAVVNMELYRSKFGLQPSAVDLVKDRLDRIIVRAENEGVPVLPGAFSFLDRLTDAGFSLAVASSAPRGYVQTVLRKTGLGTYFPVVLSGSDVEHRKPDPAIFLAARAGLNVPAERCLVVEDAHAGITAAHAAGMKVMAIRGGYTLDEQYAAADHRIDDFNDLGPADVLGILGIE